MFFPRCKVVEGFWKTLEKVFASNSQVRTLQLCLTLQTTKKGDKTMEEYISQMMHNGNASSLAGDKVSNREMTLFILGGLESKYDSLVTAVTTRPRKEALSVDEIQCLLFNHEIRITESSISEPSLDSLQANYVSRQRYNSSHTLISHINKFTPSVKVTPFSYLICQSCDKRGHIASSF